MDWYNAHNDNWGARPLCYLKSSIFVSAPYDDEIADPRADMIEEACEAVLEVLNGYPADVWGNAIAAAVAPLFQWNYNVYDGEAGFLAGFPSNFLAALLNTTPHLDTNRILYYY